MTIFSIEKVESASQLYFNFELYLIYEIYTIEQHLFVILQLDGFRLFGFVNIFYFLNLV